MVNHSVINAEERLGVLSPTQAAEERRMEPARRRTSIMPLGLPSQTPDEIRQSLPPAARAVESYQPRTAPGQYAHTIGGFAPNALTPGGVPLKAAAVFAPGLLSEAAGQLTAGTDWEPVARFAGGMTGVGGIRKIAAPTTRRAFWSGGDPAKYAAADWAVQRGGLSLEQTIPGKALDAAYGGLTRAFGGGKRGADRAYTVMKPFWETASTSFAQGAKGRVDTFLNNPNDISIWKRIEEPILLRKNEVVRHAVDKK